MRFLHYLFFSLVILKPVLGEGQGIETPQMTAAATQTRMNIIIESNTRFALELYQKLRKQRGNLIYSPYAISTALSMVTLGAKSATLAQLQSTIHYSATLSPLSGDLNDEIIAETGRNDGQVFLSNITWFQQGLKLMPSFQNIMGRDFKSSPQFVDFAGALITAVRQINQTVSKATRNRINLIISNQDLSPETKFVLTSGIVMKGQWAQIFDIKQTTRAVFNQAETITLRVELMKTTGLFPLFSQDQLDVIQIPFLNQAGTGPSLTMVIAVPKGDFNLEKLEDSLTLENWRHWIRQAAVKPVNLYMPKFRVEGRFNLIELLKEFGVTAPFSSEADFSSITDVKGIFLNYATHRTSLRIDERGSEATSSSIASPPSITPEQGTPYDLMVTRPFLFFVIDKNTETIIFMGKVIRP